MVTVIYSWSLSNYLREGKDEGFDWFGLNRFGGGPEGGPGGPIDARGRFFGAWLLGIAGRTDFFGMRIWGFGFGLIRFEFATSFAPRFRFTSFFFGIKISSYSESSSSESSSLNASRSDGGLFSIERVVRLLSYQRTPSFLTHIWIQKILRQKNDDLLPSRSIILFSSLPSHFAMKPTSSCLCQISAKLLSSSSFLACETQPKISKNTIQVPIFGPKQYKTV